MKFIFDLSIQSIKRNTLLSLGSISVVFLVSFFMFSLTAGLVLLGRSVSDIEKRVDITVFLQKDISIDSNQVAQLTSHLRQTGVAVELLSPREALSLLKGMTTIPEIIEETAKFAEDYNGKSVLQGVVIIKKLNAVSIDVLEKIINDKKYAHVVDFTYFDEQVSRVRHFLSAVAAATGLVVVLDILFIAVAGLIIFNTTRILIFSRKQEIEIMELVGARRNVLESPFYIEAAILSVIGVLCGYFLFVLAIGQWLWLSGSGDPLLHHYAEVLWNYFIGSFWWEWIKMFVIFIGISSVSTAIALKKYLPKI